MSPSDGMWSDGETLWVLHLQGIHSRKIFALSLPPHTVTLDLSPRAISENGGTATVTATLNRPSTEAVTITVSESSDAVTLAGDTLTIPANATGSTGMVTLTLRDLGDDVFTGNRFVTVSGTASSAGEVLGPEDIRLVVKDDETVPVELMTADAALDFNALEAAADRGQEGIWSDGTTMWVADTLRDSLYAYKMNPGGSDHGDRDSSRDISLHADNALPRGIWSDGETMWVADRGADKLFAYRINPGGSGHGDRDSSREFNLHADNTLPRDIWSDGETVWVADPNADRLFAYRMNPGGSGHGDRDWSRDISLHADNATAGGIWSDGETMWVADRLDDRLYAYSLGSRSRLPGRDLALDLSTTQSPSTGMWSDGESLWILYVGDSAHTAKLFALSLPDPKVTLEVTPGVISENGGTATLTASLSWPSDAVTTITVSASSADVTLSGSTLTIPAKKKAGTGSVIVTAQDNSIVDGARQVTISGSAANDEGVRGPDDVTLAVTDDDALPVVTLVVDPDTSIPENGGTARVTATLDVPSLEETTITVSITSSRRARLDSTGLTIPAFQTSSTGFLTIAAVDDGTPNGDFPLTISGSAANSAGVQGPDDVTLTIIDDEVLEPDTPENFRVTSSKGMTTFRWSDVSIPGGAVSLRYDILIREPGGGGNDWKFLIHTDYFDGTTEDDASPLTLRTLPVGETYEFALQAVAITETDGVERNRSGSGIAGEPAGPVTHTVEGPRPPRNLEADRVLDGLAGSVELTWDPPELYPVGSLSDPAITFPDPNLDTSVYGYLIYRAVAPADDGDPATPPDDGAVYTMIGDVIRGGTTYTDDTASQDDHYFYRVTAMSPDGTSDRSGYALLYSVDVSPDDPLLNQPLRLSGSVVDGDVELSWDRHYRHDEIERYRIYTGAPGAARLLAGPSKTGVEAAGEGPVEYTLAGDSLEAGGEYGIFVVGCYDSACTGDKTPASNVISVSVPGGRVSRPLDLYGLVYDGNIPLSWDRHTRHDDIERYRIFIGIPGAARLVADPSKTEVEADDYGAVLYTLAGDFLEPGNLYRIFMYACFDSACAGDKTPDSNVILVGLPAEDESGAGPLTGFMLVDASDQTALSTLADGDSVELDDPDGGSYGIRAYLAEGETVGSVGLELTGAKTVSRTENVAPYSLYGDRGRGGLNGQALPAGSYTLTATAYEDSNLGGQQLGVLEVSFTVAAAAPENPLAGFTLVDASNQNVLATLIDDIYVDLADPDGGSYGIRADLVGGETVGSVRLELTGAKTVSRTESVAPYSLYGDGGADALNGQALPAGSYTLTATAYEDANLGGDVLGSLEVSFTIVAPAAASPLSGFTLVDASNQNVLATLTNGASVELADPDGGSYGIRADIAGGETVGSVRLELTGAKSVSRTENIAPYSLYGDGGANALNGQALPAGSYTLTATAYEDSNLGGQVLGTLEISFTITAAN